MPGIRKRPGRKKATKKNLAPKELNDRHRMFVIEYIKDFNATGAAIRNGYSPKSAHETGKKILRRPEVQKYKNALLDEIETNRVKEIRSKIISTALDIISARPADDVVIKTENKKTVVKIKPTAKMRHKNAISGIKETECGRINIEYHRKDESMRLLARYIDLFEERKSKQGEELDIDIGEPPTPEEAVFPPNPNKKDGDN